MFESLIDALYIIFHPIETYLLWKTHKNKECIGLTMTKEEAERIIDVLRHISCMED